MLPLNQVLSLAIPLIITIASLQLSKRRLQNKANKIIGQAQSTADTILKEAEEFSQKNKQNIE
jgi:cell division septum initiation protein DivIVA